MCSRALLKVRVDLLDDDRFRLERYDNECQQPNIRLYNAIYFFCERCDDLPLKTIGKSTWTFLKLSSVI